MPSIKYVDWTSLVDWDGRIVCTIFVSGCNLRCWYCHNKQLWEDDNDNVIEIKNVISRLKERRGWIDGVCITGGEPTLDKKFITNLCKAVKSIGMQVKIDTNGTRPDTLKYLIKNKLVDYVAMDVKWYFDRYSEVTCVDVPENDLRRSVEIIKKSGVEYEFRTTVLECMAVDDVIEIAKQVAPAWKYALQVQRNNEKIMANSNTVLGAYNKIKEMDMFRVVKLRGVRI